MAFCRNAGPDGEDRVTCHLFKDDVHQFVTGIPSLSRRSSSRLPLASPVLFYHSAAIAAIPKVVLVDVHAIKQFGVVALRGQSSPRRLYTVPSNFRMHGEDYSQAVGRTYGPLQGSLSCDPSTVPLRFLAQAILVCSGEFSMQIIKHGEATAFFFFVEFRRPAIDRGRAGGLCFSFFRFFFFLLFVRRLGEYFERKTK